MNLFGFEVDKSTPGPEIKIGCAANVYVRSMHFLKAGHVERAHDHPFDHFTYLADKRLGVAVDGRSSVYTGPTLIFIAAGLLHTLVALDDDVKAACIHALRNGERVEDIIPFEGVPLEENPLLAAQLLERPVSSMVTRKE